MLFVTNILPHRIVGLSSDYKWEGKPEGFDPSLAVTPGKSAPTAASKVLSMETEASTVSLTIMDDFAWGYGDMRGGTPAVYLNDSRYLSFFHSTNDITTNGTQLKTYVFGAYVLDSKPPFSIQAISRQPPVHESMYTGPWTDMRLSYRYETT
jgi:hypothetical protein